MCAHACLVPQPWTSACRPQHHSAVAGQTEQLQLLCLRGQPAYLHACVARGLGILAYRRRRPRTRTAALRRGGAPRLPAGSVPAASWLLRSCRDPGVPGGPAAHLPHGLEVSPCRDGGLMQLAGRVGVHVVDGDGTIVLPHSQQGGVVWVKIKAHHTCTGCGEAQGAVRCRAFWGVQSVTTSDWLRAGLSTWPYMCPHTLLRQSPPNYDSSRRPDRVHAAAGAAHRWACRTAPPAGRGP